jgi:hypothetical protein
MKKNIKTLVSWVLILTYVLFFTIGTDGALLCFGDEGHIAIELVQSCNKSTDLGSALSPIDQQDECGPCSDVTFLTDPTIQRPLQQDVNNTSLALAITPVPEISAQVHLVNSESPYSHEHPSPALHCLKTVIIRI